MDWDLQGRVVVVTGAGRGIGRTIAEAFLAEGASVAALDVAAESVADFADRPSAAGIAVDVRDSASVATAIAAVVERFGGIDVVVNNAGINAEGRIEDLDDDAWQRCFDVNVAGVFRVTKAAIPHLKKSGRGRVINAASFAAIVPSVGSAAYAASKAAVVQFTRVVAGELGPWNVTANSYAPGMIPTAMNGFATMPEDAQSRLLDTLTLRRWGEASEIADLLLFLASDASRYITGTLIDVSGGKLATQIPARAYESAGS
ncbi:3-oxoacyl-[acyl-carrier protein] reductase [Rathayibacter oskolensis]|uniref:3-oxoacyl-[acyl-carrier protein] reductase n=1 Tax=Rathayibacter oskolensis TaxID=1891671 RepID=A0A1X7P2Y8_9MICO|nr:SDR family NAD(P)-dependent oxidoreductase [Rathayibacter oskolensis]SMH44512.1 3-oxoacyl-[acyl-carrier protein] reductase [Rathayibacter oskolensis]